MDDVGVKYGPTMIISQSIKSTKKMIKKCNQTLSQPPVCNRFSGGVRSDGWRGWEGMASDWGQRAVAAVAQLETGKEYSNHTWEYY